MIYTSVGVKPASDIFGSLGILGRIVWSLIVRAIILDEGKGELGDRDARYERKFEHK
jgi:hypothetical protein